MSAAPASLGAITLFVEDARRSKAFYADVFGAPLVHEDEASAAFRFEGALVNLLRRPAAHELVEPAAVGGANDGVRALLTIPVDDADAVCSRLAEHGVRILNGPVDRPWGVRTAAFADPDGHVWEVAQPLG